MYESFYSLTKRPFAAAPDADVFVRLPAVGEIVERLDRCIRHGRGIGVLTAETGCGKTQLCHHLARVWEKDFSVAMLPNASFPTRRGLLQAILAELGEPYQRLGETELRLKLTAVARSTRTNNAGIVLILDEAHRFVDRLLEEVRLISNLVEGGEPLFRILLAGQPVLEESLATPEQVGINERIGELVALPRMTTDESGRYLGERVAQTDGKLQALFEQPALDTLIRACGGIPRCLNQLADHSLLLGYVAECRPVKEALVLEALDDLKRLPLQWHDPPRSDSVADSEASSEAWGDSQQSSGDRHVVEFGCLDSEGDYEDGSAADEVVEDRCFPKADSVPLGREAIDAQRAKLPVDRPPSEAIQDRFARIDAAEARQRWLEELETRYGPRNDAPAAAEPRQGHSGRATQANPLQTLDRIEPLLQAAIDDEDPDSDGPPPCFDGRVELDKIVSALETSARPQGPAEGVDPVARQTTLFSDLRRRREREAGTGRS